MPTIQFRKSRLLKLLNISLSDEELEDILFNVKVEASKLPEDEDLWEAEITHDRLDMLMSEGIARTLKGVLELELGMPKYNSLGVTVKLNVNPIVSKVRPYIAVATVHNYNMDYYALEEIIQIQEKLHMTIGRGRRKVAIGIHDLDKVPSRNLVYTAKPPEEVKFQPLDENREMTGVEILKNTSKGLEYGYIIEPTGLCPLFTSDDGTVLSMPPIINSELTKITLETKNILIDVTGTDLKAVTNTINILTTTLAENADGIGLGLIMYSDGDKKYYPILEPKVIEVNLNFINKSLGLHLTVEEVEKHLKRMRFNVEWYDREAFKVYIPSYRIDILHPIDIVEDIAISIGYNTIEPRVPKTYTVGRELPKNRIVKLIRDLMVVLGFQEILTFMLSSLERQTKTCKWGPQPVIIENPISPSYNVIRSWLLPNILDFLSINQYSEHPIKVFEIGDVIVRDEKTPEKSSVKTKVAGAILCYTVSYEDVQSIVYSLLRNLGLSFHVKPYNHPTFIEGRAVTLIIEGEERGFMGEIHPEILERFKIEYPVAAFEIDITDLWASEGLR